MFELARGLRALPHLCDADPVGLEPIVRRWHQLALPVIGTKPFGETYRDFINGWKRIRYPAGSGPLDEAFARSRGMVPGLVAAYGRSELGQLVALCAELQRSAGDNPFFLACRSAGFLLGVAQVTAWRWLKLLQHQHVLKLVTVGKYATKKASEYRYFGEQRTGGAA